MTQHPPLLFVHGAFAGAWCWQEHFLPFFQNHGYDCCALDFRGHGVDAQWCCLQMLGIADYIEDLVGAVEQCQAPPILIAHSMGGFVAQQLLQTQPIDLAGLVLISPASPETHLGSALQLLCNDPLLCHKFQLVSLLPAEVWPCVITPDEARRLMLSDASSLETAERSLSKMQRESVLAMMDMFWPVSYDPPDLPCPALVLGGADDVIVPPEFIHRTADWLGADVQIVPELGHSMMLEDGWRAGADAISKWLDGRLGA